MILRYIKIALALSLAGWGLIGGLMNLIYYEDGLRGVAFVMSVTGDEESTRGISFTLLHTLGYAFIYLGKLSMGALCAIGAFQLWGSRSSDAQTFQYQKTLVLAGSGIGLFMLFFGFFVLAGTYFNPGGRQNLYLVFHQFATYYMVGIGVVTWYISQREEDQ